MDTDVKQFLMYQLPIHFFVLFVLGSNHFIKGLEWGDKELRGQWNLMSSAGPGSPSHQFSSVTQSCLTLCDLMNYSTPGFPVHHQLQELAQTYVHRVSDAIQPSHPLSAPSAPAFNLSQHQILFQRVISSNQVAKVLELQLQHQSFQWFPLGFPLALTGLILQSKGLWRVFSNTTVQNHQFFGAQLSLWFNSHIHTWPLEKP